MPYVLSALVGILIALIGHDLASQVLHGQPLRPLAGTCPACGHARGWNRRECPNCQRRPGREYLIAMVAGAASIGVYAGLGVSWSLIPYAGFLTLTTALMVTDIDALRIVDRLNIRGSAGLIVLLGIAAFLDGSVSALWRGLLGGLVYFGGSFLLFALVRGRGFGAGDVKLAAILGVFAAYAGWVVLGRAVFFTAGLGGLVAIVALVFFKASRETELPYGPSMILGSWAAIVVAGIGSGVIPA